MEQITYAFPKIKDVDPSCYIDAYNMLLECSQAHTVRSFSIRLLDVLKRACPYDQAFVFFLNANGKVSNHYTRGVPKEYVNLFLTYYLDLMSEMAPPFSIYQHGLTENSKFQFANIIDWNAVQPELQRSEFQTDYINARGLKYSWGFAFFDLMGAYRTIVAIDRVHDVPFNELEKARLGLALPILNNLHKNLFYQSTDAREKVIDTPWEAYRLTRREAEIVSLLCQGMTVQNISDRLCIAVTTTYKHLSHILAKVGVSTQKELIAKMLNQKIL